MGKKLSNVVLGDNSFEVEIGTKKFRGTVNGLITCVENKKQGTNFRLSDDQVRADFGCIIASMPAEEQSYFSEKVGYTLGTAFTQCIGGDHGKHYSCGTCPMNEQGI